MALDLPALFALTDPDRTHDPLRLAETLAPGTGLVFRHFGAADRVETGLKLAELAREGGLCLLVSADPELADQIGADGIHWPGCAVTGGYSPHRRIHPPRFFAPAAPVLMRCSTQRHLPVKASARRGRMGHSPPQQRFRRRACPSIPSAASTRARESVWSDWVLRGFAASAPWRRARSAGRIQT